MEGKIKKRAWLLVLLIILIILLIAGVLFYFATATPNKPKPGSEVKNPAENLSVEEALLGFNEDYVSYLVFAIGGWKLHNPPLSEDTPKIKVIVDGENYVSEIVSGEIKTEKKDAENEDIIIRTTKEDAVNFIISKCMESCIKQSFQQGKTSLEIKAGYATLFSKGYLSIYEDLTGKSLTEALKEI